MATKQTIKTPAVKGHFVYLVDPYTNPKTGKETYKITIAIPKKDPFWLEFKKLVVREQEENFGKKATVQNCVLDGDNDGAGNAKYPGCYYMTCNTKFKPRVITPEGVVLANNEDVYSGAIYKCLVHTYSVTFDSTKRVCCGLSAVMKVDDGERIGGSSTIVDPFDVFGIEKTGDFEDDKEVEETPTKEVDTNSTFIEDDIPF